MSSVGRYFEQVADIAGVWQTVLLHQRILPRCIGTNIQLLSLLKNTINKMEKDTNWFFVWLILNTYSCIKLPFICFELHFHVFIYFVFTACLSCVYHAFILCLPYVSMCLSCAYRVFIMCFPRVYHVFILCLPCVSMCLPCAYCVFIMGLVADLYVLILYLVKHINE